MSPKRDSLNRFLLSRGNEIIGRSAAQVGAKTHVLAGGGVLALGAALVAVAVLRGPGEMAYGAIGPVVAGVVNLSIGLSLRRRIAPTAPRQVEYSGEACNLIRVLCRDQMGWMASLGSSRDDRIARVRLQHIQRFGANNYGPRMPDPTPEVINYLERAASSYQRLVAVGEMNRNQASITKLGPRVAIAGEEAMASIFDQAAGLTRYPESGPAARKAIEAQIETLEEIALRLEELAAQTPQALGPNRSSVDDLLTDLRLEILARSELSPSDVRDSESQRAGS